MSTSQPRPAIGQRLNGLRDSGTTFMLAGAMVSALGAYVFQVMGGRGLGDVDFAPIAALWTLQFLGFTILYTPVEQLIIHRLTLAGGRADAIRSAWAIIGGIVLAGAAFFAGFAYLTRARLFDDQAVFAVITAALFLGLGGYAIARGFLAGRGRFKAYGTMVGAEAVSRIAIATIVLLTVRTAVGFAAAMALAPFVFLLFRPFGRHAAEARLGDPAGSASTFLAGLVVATAASQTILAAGPIVVGALDGSPAEVSVFFFTFTLFRGPLTASYNLLARLLPWFTARLADGSDDTLRSSLLWFGLAGAVLAGLGGAGGAVLGPPIVNLLFGVEPRSLLAAIAVSGVVLAGVALVIGQALVARSATGALAAVWLLALAVAVAAVLLSTGSASVRTGLGFLAGEAAALLGTLGVVAARVGTEPR